MTVNEKLQELMDWKGISQQRLSDLSGIARGTIGGYVSGRRNVSVEVAHQLAPVLGVTPWTLLNGEPLPATELDLSREEAQWVTDLRGLTLEQRALVKIMTDAMKDQNEHT